jgi:hypothetical protein
MTKKPDVGIKLTQLKIAEEMHDWANRNDIVALIWTPEDVQQILDDATVTIEQAQKILLDAEEEIHEFLWLSAKRYFQNAKKELINDK